MLDVSLAVMSSRKYEVPYAVPSPARYGKKAPRSDAASANLPRKLETLNFADDDGDHLLRAHLKNKQAEAVHKHVLAHRPLQETVTVARRSALSASKSVPVLGYNSLHLNRSPDRAAALLKASLQLQPGDVEPDDAH